VTAFIALGAFVLAVAILSRLWPGKTEKDLVFEANERSLYECDNLTIRRYPDVGRPVLLPRSKIQITNQRVIFSQKGLWSTTYVIREIAVRKNHTLESLKNKHFWGQVPIYELDEDDFSIENQNNETHVVFKNVFAPNLKRMEIAGVDPIETFMQAVASTDSPASQRLQ
jgi:hypothetical protein